MNKNYIKALMPPEHADRYDHLIVHVTATAVTQTEVDAEWVDRVHRNKGWNGCGYNAVITRDAKLQHGPLYKTRPYGVQGAHVGDCGPGWNRRAIGISLAGGVALDYRTPEDNVTEEQLDVLRKYVKAAMEVYGIPRENVMGHRDLIKMTGAPPKACPCFDTAAVLWNGQGPLLSRMFDFSSLNGKADKLRVPRIYTVKAGDTSYSIGKTYGVPLPTLALLNPTADLENIQIGQKMRLMSL